MIYRKQDINGDYVFGAGSNNFLYEIAAVAQAIKTKLLLFTGEWWENENEGIPMIDGILGVRGANKNNADLLIVKRIKEVPQVLTVSNVDSSYDASDRSYSFSCVVTTAYGQIAITNQGGA